LLGTVFKDSNTNGVVDAGEGLSGVTVVLASNAVTVAQTTTGPQGQYTFNAAPGVYTVSVVGASLPGGLMLVPVIGGATNSPWPVSLVSDFPQTVNWGYRAAPLGAVTGIVFRDSNTNGVPDTGEALGGVVLQLQTNGVTVAQSTTDSSGRYSFTNTPGSYSLRLNTNTLPVGLVAVAVSSGAGSNPANVTLPANGVSVLNWGFRRPGAAQFQELSGLVQFGLSWSLNRARGTLVGSLSLTNLPGSGSALTIPWQLGMKTSSQFFYPTNFGVGVSVLPDGVPCVDLSGAMQAQYGAGPVGAGQRLTLTNAVEIYSLTRSAPPDSQFELWATRQ